jgi:hypothetical protein
VYFTPYHSFLTWFLSSRSFLLTKPRADGICISNFRARRLLRNIRVRTASPWSFREAVASLKRSPQEYSHHSQWKVRWEAHLLGNGRILLSRGKELRRSVDLVTPFFCSLDLGLGGVDNGHPNAARIFATRFGLVY